MGRPDGTRVKDIPRYRQIMPYFMRTKAESLVYYDKDIESERGEKFCRKMSKDFGTQVTFFHLVLHALFKVHHAYPRVNRFVKGGKIYQRKGIYFSFSVKKEMTSKAKVSIVKRRFDPGFTLRDTVRVARKDIKKGRSKKSIDEAEKEVKNYLWIPSFIIKLGFPIYKFRDEHGLFSKRYMEKEVLYSSSFVANVGAFGCDSLYHHLYEYGTISSFMILGKIREVPKIENGKVVIKRALPIKITLDERVEDGFYYYRSLEYFVDQLENPEKLLEPAEIVER